MPATASVPFISVIEALGGIISGRPDRGDHWEFYKVRYPTPAGEIIANYLYLTYDCPLREATQSNRSRWKSFAQPQGNYIVAASTRSDLGKDLQRTKREFGGQAATTPRRLLYDNVLDPFRGSLKELPEYRYFISPDVTRPDGKFSDAVIYLGTWLGDRSGAEDTDKCATVVVANAGLGKTTLCREIARRLLKREDLAIPVLVESEHWRNSINPSLPNVLNTALLQILPEASSLTNAKIFQVLVQERLLIPIFDGFDELCLHPTSEYSAAGLLTALLRLIGDTGARILITTRQTFWDKYRADIPIEKIVEVGLKGFSNSQRHSFFNKRLELPAERDIANRIGKEIGGSIYPGAPREDEQVLRSSAVPLFLELIAVYVEGNPNATFSPDTADPLGPLLTAVCEREEFRQELSVSAEVQMAIFEDLFRDFSDDIPAEWLDTYIEDHVPGITKDAVARFHSHAFLTTGKDFRPRFEILTVYFVARWLAGRLLNAVTAEESQVTEILARQSGGNTPILDWLVSRFSTLPNDKLLAATRHAFEMIRAKQEWRPASAALFHLIAGVAHQNQPTRRERTEFIAHCMSAYEGSQIRFGRTGLEGQIEGMDFGGVQFERCALKDIDFRNCRFDEQTRFARSRFDGSLDFENCEGAALIKVDECELSELAERGWDRQFGRASRPAINDAAAKDALRQILRKFTGRFGFSTIKEEDKNAGPIGRNPCKDAAWEELERCGIVERHEISGVKDGGLHISDQDEVRHEVRSFLDNAILGPTLSKVAQSITRRA